MRAATIEKAWELLSFLRASAAEPKTGEMQEFYNNLQNFMDFFEIR